MKYGVFAILLSVQLMAQNSLEVSMQERGVEFASPMSEYDLIQVKFVFNVSKPLQEDIAYIIQTMGKRSYIGLLREAGKLRSAGKRIDGVPTLEFLAVIFSNDTLKASMKKIHKSNKKWKEIMNGVTKGLQTQFDNGQLKDQLPGFATYVGADLGALEYETNKKSWEGFVAVLMR